MNKNLNKFFENDFENVNWMDLFKNPKYFNQDAKVEKIKYVPKPWEVKRNYQLERDNYDMRQLYCDDISDAEYLQNTFDFYKSTKLSLSDFLIQFDITRLRKFNYDKIRSDYELSKNKEQELRDKIPELKKMDKRDLSNREKKMLSSYLHHTFTIQRLRHYDENYCDGELELD